MACSAGICGLVLELVDDVAVAGEGEAGVVAELARGVDDASAFVEEAGDHDTARASGVPDAARQPCRHLLEEPAVPVRIPERGVAVVRGATAIRTRNASAVQMEQLADVDAAADEIVTRRLDVGHDELQTLLGARRHLVAPEHS